MTCVMVACDKEGCSHTGDARHYRACARFATLSGFGNSQTSKLGFSMRPLIPVNSERPPKEMDWGPSRHELAMLFK